MLQLGFVSAILGEIPLEKVLHYAQQIGYDCIEVMCWPPGKATRRYAGVTHLDVSEFSASQADQILALFEKYQLKISGLGYYPNPLSPDQEESSIAIKHLQKVIKAAALLGINQVNTFIGRDWKKSVDENWPQFLAVWKPLIALAEQENVRIGIENCPMLFTQDEWPGGKNLASSPAIWKRMFADIPSQHFGLNYDPSHPTFMQMDSIQPMSDFKDKLFHIHAKDVRVYQDKLNHYGILAYPNLYHSPKLPGLGEVPWGKFFSMLTSVGYRGPVCVEVEDRAYEHSLESRLLALQQSHDFLRNFIPRLVIT